MLSIVLVQKSLDFDIFDIPYYIKMHKIFQQVISSSAYDNMGWLADPVFSRKPIQGQIFHRQQVAHRKIGVVESVVVKRRISGVQDLVPFFAEIAAESIFQRHYWDIGGNRKPYFVKVANGNHPAVDESPGFIKIDRQGRHPVARIKFFEIGKDFAIHGSKDNKMVF